MKTRICVIVLVSGVVARPSLCVPTLTAEQRSGIEIARGLLAGSSEIDANGVFAQAPFWGALEEKIGLQGAKQALIDLAALFPDAGELDSDGSLETELVRIGASLADSLSKTHELQAVLQLSPSEVLGEDSEIVVPHHPRDAYLRRLPQAFVVDYRDVQGMSGEAREELRIAWQAVLLMPTMVGQTRRDAGVGAGIALSSLVVLRDSHALPVLVERARIDVEDFGIVGRSVGSDPLLFLRCAARFAITDGEVTQLDVGHLVDLVGIIESSEPSSEPWIDYLLDRVDTSGWTPYLQPVSDSVAERWREPVLELAEYEVFAVEWLEAFAAFPREGLTQGQVRFLDELLGG